MRLHLSLLATLTLASCVPINSKSTGPTELPATPPKRADAYPGNTSLPLSVEQETAPTHPEQTSRFPLGAKKTSLAGVTFTYVAFDTRTHTIAVIDQAGGPGTKYTSASAVTAATQSRAAINGGFFTPEGDPLGIIYHEGKKIGALNTASSLGSGVVYTDASGSRPVITRRDQFKRWVKTAAAPPREALQTGPFLVENSLPVAGLKGDSPRIRSLLLSDGEHHFAFAQCGPITLQNLAGALAKQPLTNFHITTALNLDGGSSADLHVPAKTSGGPLNLRRWLNKPVRNYLILKEQ